MRNAASTCTAALTLYRSGPGRSGIRVIAGQPPTFRDVKSVTPARLDSEQCQVPHWKRQIFTVSKLNPHQSAGDQLQNELALEDTGTIRARVDVPTRAEARALYEHDVSGPDDKTTSLGELRALSARIKARRGIAELNKGKLAAHSEPKK